MPDAVGRLAPTGVHSRAVLATLLALVASLIVAYGPAAPAHAAETDPLAITLDSLSPAVLGDGDIHLAGHITNNDDQTWRHVNIYPFASRTPIQSTGAFATAQGVAENVPVGDRITQVSDTIETLEPGASAAWSITVPRSLLARTPGVYWFGAHALGTNDAGTDKNADGRARTFLTLIAGKPTPTRLHLVVELREPIAYDDQGRLAPATANGDAWASELKDRLARQLQVAAAAPGASLLVDPALVDAISRLGAGNPTWFGDGAAASDVRTAAQAWLSSFTSLARHHVVYALPYGDVDLVRTRADPTIATNAVSRSLAPLRALGIAARVARHAPTGTAAAVVQGAAGSTIFADTRTVGSLSTYGGAQFVGTAIASAGAPGPGDPYAPVAFRQQILAEAGLHAGTTSPVIVDLPPMWVPADPAAFVRSLKTPWTSFVSLNGALRGRTATAQSTLPTTTAVPAGRASIDSYRTTISDGVVLGGLAQSASVTDQIVRAALASLSYAFTDSAQPQALADTVRGLVQNVSMSAPPGVTLSGSSGRFSVSISNPLPVPVTVALRASTDADTAIGKLGAVTIPARGVGSVLVSATVARAGVHRVEFALVDGAGKATGVTTGVQVRSVQVSGVIWAFIAGGVGLLAVAIAVRLVRRIRNRR